MIWYIGLCSQSHYETICQNNKTSELPMVARCRWSQAADGRLRHILIRSNNARQSAHGNKPYLYSRHVVYRRRCANPHGAQPAPGRRLKGSAAAAAAAAGGGGGGGGAAAAAVDGPASSSASGPGGSSSIDFDVTMCQSVETTNQQVVLLLESRGMIFAHPPREPAWRRFSTAFHWSF